MRTKTLKHFKDIGINSYNIGLEHGFLNMIPGKISKLDFVEISE